MTMRPRLAHRAGRSSQATTAAVDKSSERLTHRNPDAPAAPSDGDDFASATFRRLETGYWDDRAFAFWGLLAQ